LGSVSAGRSCTGDTLDVRPLPGVAHKQFTARDLISKWDVVEARSRASSHTAKEFIDTLLRQMPLKVKAMLSFGRHENHIRYRSPSCKTETSNIVPNFPPSTGFPSYIVQPPFVSRIYTLRIKKQDIKVINKRKETIYLIVFTLWKFRLPIADLRMINPALSDQSFHRKLVKLNYLHYYIRFQIPNNTGYNELRKILIENL